MRSIAILALLLTISSGYANARPLSGKEKNVVIKAVKGKLKDPASAKFKLGDWKGKLVYCGLVNAKNSFGGYPGFAPFQIGVMQNNDKGPITSAMVLAIGTSDPDSNESQVVMDSCAREGYEFND